MIAAPPCSRCSNAICSRPPFRSIPSRRRAACVPLAFRPPGQRLFVALFVIELFVALTDSAVPWFIGRIVTLVTTIPPERFLAETWPWLVGMALVVLVARPGVVFARYLVTNQAIRRPSPT